MGFNLSNPFDSLSFFSLDKSDEDENLPSMEALEISQKNNVQSISTYFGGEEEEEEDIPDMAEYEEPDSVIDPVRGYSFLCWFHRYLTCNNALMILYIYYAS